MSNTIEISGTISSVLPIEYDHQGTEVTRLLLSNVNTTSQAFMVSPSVLLYVRMSGSILGIYFKVGDPITAKGYYNRNTAGTGLDSLDFTFNPVGFVRYLGRVHK